MGSSDFYIDFNIEVPNIADGFTREAEQRLRKLETSHSDLIGAAISLERIVKAETSYLFQVRIVVYKRPQDIVIVKKDADPMTTLRAALEALEEKVRESREKLAQREIHKTSQIESIYYDLSAEEIYATFAKELQPEEILNQDRTEIASRLMVEEGLAEEAAYFAADQMLRFAERITGDQE